MNLEPEIADRLTEVARCLAITGETKTSVVEQALRVFFEQLEKDPSYQDLEKRVVMMRKAEFVFRRTTPRSP